MLPLAVTGAHKQALLVPLVVRQSSIEMLHGPQARGEIRYLIEAACKMESVFTKGSRTIVFDETPIGKTSVLL
jgi:hypothetical protein